jgi:hypothetical protein
MSLQAALEDDLKTIHAGWRSLLNLPRTPGGDKVDTSMASPTPLPIGVLSLRFDAAQQLAAWAHLVWDERNLHTHLDLMNTPAVCKFLHTHAAWLAAHPAGRDAAEEISLIAGKVTELIEQTRPRQFIVGSCVVDDCPGQLAAVLRNSDVVLPSEIQCTLDPEHRWSPGMWAFMGRSVCH